MPSSSGIKAGAAYYELTLKDGKLTKGLRAWKGKLKAFGESIRGIGLKLSGLGAALEAPLAASVGVFASMGAEMQRASTATGVQVEALSQLAYAAKDSGVEMDGLEMGLRKMQQKLGEALQGNNAAITSFAMLGVNINNLRNLSPDKQFEALADALTKVQDPAKRAAMLMDIFGREGMGLAPLMLEGAKGIQRLRAEADRLGLTMSGKDADAAVSLAQRFSSLWDQVKMGAFNIGSALVPALEELGAKVSGWLTVASKWIKAHKEVVVWAAKIVAGIMAAGAALVVIGTLFTSAAAVCGGLATALSFLGTLLGVAASAIGMVVAAVGAILSPVGLVVAAVVGLGATIAVKTGAAASACKFLGGAFDTLKGDAVTAFGGIKDALAAGDFKLAAQILWTTLKLEWTRGINFLDTQWIEFTGMFQDAWTKAVYFTAGVFTEAWAGLQAAWQETIGFLCDSWSVFTGFIQKAWFSAVGFVQKAWVRLKGLFDKDINVDAEVNKIDSDTDAKKQAVQDRQNAAIAQREAKRKAELDRIERDRVGTLAALKESKDAELAAHQKARAEKEKALQQEITDLIVKRDGLIQHAEDERHSPTGYRPGESAGGVPVKKVQDELIYTMKSVVGGTFAGATAGRQLGGTNLQQKMVHHLSSIDRKTAAHNHWRQQNENLQFH
ncbi:MAG TPA: hypothetical protein VHX65_01520 [Pirellulales bacterium]|jgi:hypothetical protein|nr:hypothetical protein [Pirellulales bacterium]